MFRSYFVECLIISPQSATNAGFIAPKSYFNNMEYLLHLPNITEKIALLHTNYQLTA